ncbi:PD40 domain-containing protein [Sulfuracidifex tepidarius]|uniref:PD40 domain-containing protein n=1 Tax=Sulfuracidifex tepidarius TaxID=1294262 RepID=UPI0006CF377C|nr:PD40 domain-containing protein [Sulfuracidifex tepidarius]
MAYLMYPDIHGEKIAFASEDDLWVMKLGESKPTRLTSGFGAITKIKFSPKGDLIAFTRLQISGNSAAEVYVIPTEGGNVKRVTFFGSPTTTVVGWTPEGKLLVSSDFQTPFAAWRDLFEVDPNGGEPKRLNLGPVTAIAYGEKAFVIGRNNYDLTYWKRYKGGTRGVFWIDRGYKGEFVKFLELDGNLNSPMWVDGRFYFVSDHEGIGNLYSVDIEGKDLRKHTDMKDFYVRNANTDGKRIVFQSGGEIYLYQEGKALKLDINVPISGKQKQEFFDEGKSFNTFSPFSSDQIAVINRGRAYLLSWDSAPIPIGDISGNSRYKIVSSDGESILLVRYDDVIEVYDKDGEKKAELKPKVGMITGAKISKSRIVLSNKRGDLYLLSDGMKLIDHSDYGEITDFTINQNGWITYSKQEDLETFSIWTIIDDKKFRVTNATGRDFCPTFSNDGKYLFFLSVRHFDPVMDEMVFAYDFPAATKPFVAVMKKGVPSPFLSMEGDGELNLKGL